MAKENMKVLFVASECGPFIRTGGLGDVAAALPKELNAMGNDVRVIIPLYEDISIDYKSKFTYVGNVYVKLAWREEYAGVFEYDYNGVKYYFIDNEKYFKRSGLYGYFDDGERFAFFSKAVLDVLPLIDFKPDVIHSNDWHTALVPVYQDAIYCNFDFYRGIKTVFTIHNIQFQGRFSLDVIKDIVGLPDEKFSVLEYDRDANFMKGAIEASNKITTVSPNYAKEILDPYFAYGLSSILSDRYYKISGIVNGIDQNLFNPKTDKHIYKNYDNSSFELGKKINKDSLLENLNLQKANQNTMLIGMVTRLTEQKGIDIFVNSVDEILKQDVRIAILGQGDWYLEKLLNELQLKYPDKLRVIINFSTDIANKIYAASDVFLMPSKFEPCGLSQLIAMSYGTIPIVREIGGLKDTVKAYNTETKKGSGFTFYDYSSSELIRAVQRAYEIFSNKKEWNSLIKCIMEEDLSWKKSAKQYLELYKSI